MKRSRFTLVHDAVELADAAGRTQRALIEKTDLEKPARKKKKTGKKGEGNSLIISKSRTKAATKKCNVSSDFYGALDAKVREIIKGAEDRATENKRKTLKPYDL